MPLYERPQDIRETVLSLEHPDVAQALKHRASVVEKPFTRRCRSHFDRSMKTTLATLCTPKYTEAEQLYERSQAIREKVLGPEHPDVATSVNNRAWLLCKQYAEAEPLFERSQSVRENVLDPEHVDVATTLNGRAVLCHCEVRYSKAESLYERSQAIREKVLGPEHPDV
ncbi:unnamed protein product, partial [Ectocarpus sp. 12 AP-2014]